MMFGTSLQNGMPFSFVGCDELDFIQDFEWEKGGDEGRTWNLEKEGGWSLATVGGSDGFL